MKKPSKKIIAPKKKNPSSTSSSEVLTSLPSAFTSQGLKTALLSSLGSGLEYYDFVVYGMMGAYLAPLFFPASSPLSSFLQTLSVFALGYLVRPLGGIVFGALADRYGRRQAFLKLMGLMAATTLSIGILPTYSQIGGLAPLLLVVCRIGQGISFGAELPGAIVLVSETSQEKNHSKGCSWVISSTSLGALSASLVLFLLTTYFSQDQILEGIWRVPFLVGGVAALLFFFLRKNLKETHSFMQYMSGLKDKKQAPLYISFLSFMRHHSGKSLLGSLLALFPGSLVILNLYFPIYMKENFGYDSALIYKSITLSLGIGAFTIPFFGWVEDKVNRAKFLISVIFFGILTAPFFWSSLKNGQTFSLISFMIWYQTILGAATTSYLPLLAKLFPTSVRYTGVAFSYNLALSTAAFLPALAAYGIAQTQNPGFIGFILAGTASGALASAFIILASSRKTSSSQ